MTANKWVSKLEKIAKQEEPNDVFARFRELYATVWPNIISPPNTLPQTFPTTQNISTWPPRSPLDEFFNITYLDAEATCSITGRKIQKGEPVLILFEHVICKEAFQKMLVKQFESMMFRMEDMAEVQNYDS